MKSSYIYVGAGVLVVLVLVYLYVTGQLEPTQEVTPLTLTPNGDCIKKKGAVKMIPWEEWKFDQLDWNQMDIYAKRANPEVYQIDRDGAVQGVVGFFKGMDLAPTQQAFKAYRGELKQYLEIDGGGVGDVSIGILSCN